MCTNFEYFSLGFFLYFGFSRKLDKLQDVLLTHGDSITKTGERLKMIAISSSEVIAGIWDNDRIFGVQFHPEVSSFGTIF